MAVRKKLPQLRNIAPVAKKSHSKSVAEMKKKYRQLPLHFLFGIKKEIDFQCPLLDEYLEKLEEVKMALEKIRKSTDLETSQILAAGALHSIDNVPNGIDMVTRINFENLRKTSEDWKQLAIAAINETKNPERFLKV